MLQSNFLDLIFKQQGRTRNVTASTKIKIVYSGSLGTSLGCFTFWNRFFFCGGEGGEGRGGQKHGGRNFLCLSCKYSWVGRRSNFQAVDLKKNVPVINFLIQNCKQIKCHDTRKCQCTYAMP